MLAGVPVFPGICWCIKRTKLRLVLRAGPLSCWVDSLAAPQRREKEARGTEKRAPPSHEDTFIPPLNYKGEALDGFGIKRSNPPA